MISILQAWEGRRRAAGACLIAALLLLLCPLPALSAAPEGRPYTPLPGLVDLRTTFSDGAHGIEEIVRMGRSRGFRVFFINDHNRITLAYGLPPFRRLLRYGKTFPSVMTHGAGRYLEEIRSVSRAYPDVILVPGCESSPFHYWSGSWLRGDLTVHDYDRRILVIGLDRAEDYEGLPGPGGPLTLRNTRELLPGLLLFLAPLGVGLLLLRSTRFYRRLGLVMILLSGLAAVDYNPFRSSLFSPYAGDQGIAPYQDFIDEVRGRGGLSFWNYPEQRSGVRTHGPIRVQTLPYPEVLEQSRGYTGFAAIYGDRISATDPGAHWDRALNAYCRGLREQPPWGIATADFHADGRLGLKLGAFPTTFLVREFSREAVLEAMAAGRMFCSRGDGRVWPRLEDFSVLGDRGHAALMGETLTTSRAPLVRFRVSLTEGDPRFMKILLIRGGTLLKSFEGPTPLEGEFIDQEAPAGPKTFYRVMDSRKHLTSNPIFVIYRPAS